MAERPSDCWRPWRRSAPTEAESRPGWALSWQQHSGTGLEETVVVRATGAKNTPEAKTTDPEHQLQKPGEGWQIRGC